MGKRADGVGAPRRRRCLCPSLLSCCIHWATSGGSLHLTAGAAPSQGGAQGAQQPEEPSAPGPGPRASLPGPRLQTETGPFSQVPPGRAGGLWGEASGRVPGPGVAGGGCMWPRKQVPFPTLGTEGTQSFWPGWSTVRKGPPCGVVPRATIRACTRDHMDGSSAESPLLHGPRPQCRVCVKTGE